VESQVTYYVSYSCPRCKAELEVQHGSWQGWRLCPACGLPSLPPELLFGHPTTRRRVLGRDDEPILLNDVSLPEDSIALDRAQIVLAPPSGVFSGLRVFFLIGLVVSLFLLLLFYLDQNQQLTGIFGALSFIFFLLMLRSPMRRSINDE
jgi:hypothetical protein